MSIVTSGIRLLPNHLVNQIAAGEVVERPASVVKELVENALDAGATEISVEVVEGGKNKLVITDNGKGMNQDELGLAVQRHATSKLPGDDLVNITTMGFRGEALPSIGSISRLKITSRVANTDHGHELSIEGGVQKDIKPAAAPFGTKIEVRDIFYATPARLKFLKTATTEIARIHEVINQLAMANPEVSFQVRHNDRKTVTYQSADLLQRLQSVMGKDFAENAVAVEVDRENCRLSGYCGVPTFNRGNAAMQFLFVNNRPVKDRLLNAAVRVAYQDFLSRDRHPYVALFLTLPPETVDVNAHPAKTEVRFEDAAMIRGTIISALKQALQQAGHQASTTVANQTLNAFQAIPQPPQSQLQAQFQYTPRQSGSIPPAANAFNQQLNKPVTPSLNEGALALAVPENVQEVKEYPLGAAVAQIHKTYIVAQTSDGMVLVDQHAAHERLTYETMKAQLAEKGIARQALLAPEVVDISEEGRGLLLSKQQELEALGLLIESFGQSILVKEVPAVLKNLDVQGLICDIADELIEHGSALSLTGHLHEIFGNMACRSSIKAGRELHSTEMNTLLRQMEATPHSGQCNHGRPTYVKLALADIEKLFGRR